MRDTVKKSAMQSFGFGEDFGPMLCLQKLFPLQHHDLSTRLTPQTPPQSRNIKDVLWIRPPHTGPTPS